MDPCRQAEVKALTVERKHPYPVRSPLHHPLPSRGLPSVRLSARVDDVVSYGIVYCSSINVVVAVSRPRQRVPDKIQENRPPPDPKTKLTSLRVAFALPLTLSASASACDGGCQDPENLSKLRKRSYMYNVAFI